MKRMQLLAFQRKLLISTLSLPRQDALNLLKIVRSNLDEFVEIRLYDTNPDKMDRLAEELFGIYDLWARTVLKRFPFLSTMDSREYWDNDTITYSIEANHVKTPTSPRTNMEHYYAVSLETAMEGSSIPAKWLKSFKICFDPNIQKLCVFGKTVSPTGEVVYRIRFKYKQLVYFRSLDDAGNGDALKISTGYVEKYENATSALQSTSFDNDAADESLYRFPLTFSDKTGVITLPRLLEIKYNVTSSTVDECWITIYRTDLDGAYLSSDTFIKFFFSLARRLGKKAHFFVELRARGESKNNLRLVDRLMDDGADVCVIPQNSDLFNKKVHGKMMIFRRNTTWLQVYSTGNFFGVAEACFRDTVLIRRYGAPVEPILMMNTLMGKYEIAASPDMNMDFVWKPGEISLLIQMICRNLASAAISMASFMKQFLYIKCNGLTDPDVCREILSAADAGVDVRVICRTTCDLPYFIDHPNIKVVTLCGRYLEHDRFIIAGHESLVLDMDNRIYIKHAYITSADLMPRNMRNRVEFAVRLNNQATERKLYDLFQHLWEDEFSPKDGLYRFPMTYAMNGEEIVDDDDDMADETTGVQPIEDTSHSLPPAPYPDSIDIPNT